MCTVDDILVSYILHSHTYLLLHALYHAIWYWSPLEFTAIRCACVSA